MTDAAGGFEAAYFPDLAAVEDRHFWFRARNAVIRAAVEQIETRLPSGYRVLEVGCGTGNTLRVLEGVCRRGSVVGVDAHYDGLAVARRRVACPLVAADLAHLPIHPSVRFDFIGMFDVLEHIQDDRAALAAVRARMKAGGILLLTVPAGPELWSAFDVAAHHCRRYTADVLRDVLESSGFTVGYLSPFMAGLYPLAWMRRRLIASPARDQVRPDAVLADLRVVPVVNGCLAWLFAAEPRLVASRRRLPFGTSLIASAAAG